MNMSEEARAFRTMPDDICADLMNGRIALNEALAWQEYGR